MTRKLNNNQLLWNKKIEEEYNKKEVNLKETNLKETNLKETNLKKEINQNLKKNIEKTKEKNIENFEDLKKEFSKLKEEYYKVDTDETLKKWKILSKAYELGKSINGTTYSIFKLSEDFEIPYTTAKRILSLDKANRKTMALIKEKKISAFRVAQICMTKNHKHQDEIINMAVKDNLSTTQIKKLKIDKRGDIKKARLDAALEKGFSRRDVAYRSLRDTLNRLNRLLDMKKEELPESKIIELVNLMEEIKDKLQIKINEFN